MATPKPGKMHSPVEAQAAADKGLKMKIKRTKTGTKHEIVKSGENGEKKRGGSGHTRDKKHGEKGKDPAPPPKEKEAAPPPPPPPPPPITNSTNVPPASSSENPTPPPLVPQVPPPSSEPPPPPPPSPPPSSTDKETADACVGTSVGTVTEPDCLGPCEPGTSVTLEGIVWHETEGVLVVNVTWRGKTYIGTLLDCTKHEWAPPRFSDSPTADLDVRTPRRGGKRGRNSGVSLANDLANFTETRSSVYSKLRNSNAAGAKGKRGPGSASPTPFASPKNDATPNKRKNKSEGEEPAAKKKPVIPPPTTERPQTQTPPPPPVLLECPEPNCSKKYKDVNGLKYHQSHAHGMPGEEENKEFDSSEEEEPNISIDLKKDESTETSAQVDEAEESEDKQLLRLAFGTNMMPGSPAPLLPPTTSSSPSPPLIDPPSLNIPSQPPTLTKVLPFKVKPASALMEDKNPPPLPSIPLTGSSNLPQNPKKKSRKSPAGSPHPSPLKSPGAMIHDSGVQEGVQSHTYSDISDDDAPLLESEVESKPTNTDEMKGQSPKLQPFGMYPYYGQPPYLVPSVSDKVKENSSDKIEGKVPEKDKKEGEFHLQKMLSHSYFQDDFPVPGSYQFNMEGGYPVVMDDKKNDTPGTSHDPKRIPPSINIPSASKLKTQENSSKEKHQNENHQIIKESIEMKSQINNSFMFQRQQQQSQEEVRQFYLYPDRKEGPSNKTPQQKPHPLPSPRQKDKPDDKKERSNEKKQEGIKPTMETTGPPPPSQFAYIHPGYMQTPPYGALPYDPSHPMYRGMNPMLVSGYPNPPFLHPPLHRYAPEDLSQGQSGKALDLLQHHASQYYGHPSHKIHELQERAIKSPTPKPPVASTSSPSPSVSSAAPVKSSPGPPTQGKGPMPDGKDTRSPPPQRHIHTHHHTHVGLGYPILTGQYPAPFGAEDIRIPGTKFVPPPVVKKE